MSRHPERQLWWTIALCLGFLALCVATVSAHLNPATGYEVSIYTLTSPIVWAGLLVAMSVALIVSFAPTVDRVGRSVGLVLGGLTMTVFAGLPIVRGYRFYGHHDALTHLGWARAISDGTMSPFELFYPAVHTVSAIITATLDIPVSQALMLVVLTAAVLFWIFVPLTVGAIAQSDRAYAIGAFSAFLLLPITTISMYLEAHTMTQAVLFSTVLLFLFVTYVRPGEGVSSRSAAGHPLFSATGVLFGLVAVATVVYHPQLGAHLIAVFLAIATVQYVARRRWETGRIAGQTPVYGVTALLIGMFLLWTANHGFFSGVLEYFAESAVEFVFGGSGGEANVAAQGASLGAIGGSLLEIFLKLFSAHLVFGLLAGGLALAVGVVRHAEWIRTIRAETTYCVVALASLVPIFVVYFAEGATMYFRVAGLMLVFVTILGALALTGIADRLSRPGSSFFARASGQPVIAAGFAVLLIVSLAPVFPSPYIYNATPHVSDAQMGGYETAFDTQDDDIGFVGLRDGPNRFDDAVNGNAERMGTHQDVPDSLSDGIAAEYDEDQYLVLTQTDHDRETIAYGELRYNGSDFDAVEADTDLDRIQSNGEFTQYYVSDRSTTA